VRRVGNTGQHRGFAKRNIIQAGCEPVPEIRVLSLLFIRPMLRSLWNAGLKSFET